MEQILGNWRDHESRNNNAAENQTVDQQKYQIPQRRNPPYVNNSWRNRYHSEDVGVNIDLQQWKWRNRSDSINHISSKQLEEWSSKEPDSIILEVLNQKVKFKEVLDSELNMVKLVLVVKIFAKVCEAPFQANKNEIMNFALQENFISQLKNYIISLQTHKWNSNVWNDPNEFFNNVTVIYKYFIENIPKGMYEKLVETLKAIFQSIFNFEFEQEVEVDYEIKAKFEKLLAKLILVKPKLESAQSGERSEENKVLTDTLVSVKTQSAGKDFIAYQKSDGAKLLAKRILVKPKLESAQSDERPKENKTLSDTTQVSVKSQSASKGFIVYQKRDGTEAYMEASNYEAASSGGMLRAYLKAEHFAIYQKSKKNKYRCECDSNKECEMCQFAMIRISLPCSHQHIVPYFTEILNYICVYPVRAELPCGHVAMDKPCYENVETYPCSFPCDTRIEPCGHACVRTCHVKDDPDHIQYKCLKPCVKFRKGCSTKTHSCPLPCHEDCPSCHIVLQKSRKTCPHTITVACNVNVDVIQCQEMIFKKHPECDHLIESKCCEEPSRKNCKENCPLVLKCGHQCQNKCNEPCTTECRATVDRIKPLDCGHQPHQFKIKCYLRDTVSEVPNEQLPIICEEPCRVRLACSHICSGTCNGCAQGRIHKSCREKCDVSLICGHECIMPCNKACQPCTRKCPYKCKHSACKKTCGEPCTSCVEDCERRCKHIQCAAKCGDICTVLPCTEPCDKHLTCGHKCIGYCGDPCPPLCKICNFEEFSELFPEYKYHNGIRYVLLDECKHIVESREMDKWSQQPSTCCPKCKTPLTSTLRYSDHIKRDVIAMKEVVFGDPKENEEKRLQLLTRLENLQKASLQLSIHSKLLGTLVKNFKEFLNPVFRDKMQPFNKFFAKAYDLKISFVNAIVVTFNTANFKNSETRKEAVNYIDFLFKHLLKLGHSVSTQQTSDFKRELKRFMRIVKLLQLANLVNITDATSNNCDAKMLYDQATSLAFAASVYTDELDAKLKNILSDLKKLQKTKPMQ